MAERSLTGGGRPPITGFYWNSKRLRFERSLSKDDGSPFFLFYSSEYLFVFRFLLRFVCWLIFGWFYLAFLCFIFVFFLVLYFFKKLNPKGTSHNEHYAFFKILFSLFHLFFFQRSCNRSINLLKIFYRSSKVDKITNTRHDSWTSHCIPEKKNYIIRWKKTKKKFITCLIVFKLNPLHPNKKLWFLKSSCFPW